MGKILCFGELLLRMSPMLNREWLHSASIPVYVGGAELNAAHALAKWNIPTSYFTALPDHYLSKEIVDELNSKQIETDKIIFSGARIGAYYLPQGVDLKNAGVIYDRAHSSFAELKPCTLDWQRILDGISWLHFSAICPALNNNAALICKEVLEAAVAKNITISVDLNYRAKLWQYDKAPVQVMPELVNYCNVVMGNLWAVDTMLGIPSPIKESTGRSKQELVDAAGESMLQLHKEYPKVTDIAYTFRLDKTYFGVLQHGAEQVISKEHILGKIKDKVGSGDCFMAGLIYGLYNKHVTQDIIDFAATAAVNKLYEIGDATNRSEAEIRSLMNEQVIA